jgi:hypothetical protein
MLQEESRGLSLASEKTLGEERRFYPEERAMKCRNCGTENPDDATLCAKCGATLPTTTGRMTLVPVEYFDAFPLAIGFFGFLLMVAGAWIIGDRLGGELGAGVFLALLGTVMMTVMLVHALFPDSK